MAQGRAVQGAEETPVPADRIGGGPHSKGEPPRPPHATAMVWLLRRASGRYRATVRTALDQAGYADLVQRGYWVLDELDRGDRTAAALVSLMGVTKQAISQLIDQLVGLDYVQRLPDPLDGRRTLLRPTARGRAAAEVVQRAVASVERDVGTKIGASEVASLAAALRRFVGDPDPDDQVAPVPPSSDRPDRPDRPDQRDQPDQPDQPA